ncbi:hypothetical protein BAUCODRAFT_60368, partial [Baudoinia panamericana UAMH 10762]
LTAIHKPPHLSSAQVIRNVQEHFNASELFRPWLEREQAKRDTESPNQKSKRRSWKQRQPMQVKMGHGGTLDPMATGVLVLGVGSGTKQLSQFLHCTKSYDAVVLFGAATDSYDSEGKVVAQAPYKHVTRSTVEEALNKFRGSIMQRPPIFSALRVQGKRLYEYAREGKEVPIEIQERPVQVEQLELVEWFDCGKHQWNWPSEQAEEEVRGFAEKVFHFGEAPESAAPVKEKTTFLKRRREDDVQGEPTLEESVNGVVTHPTTTEAPLKRSKTSPEPVASGAPPDGKDPYDESTYDEASVPTTDEPVQSVENQPCPAPAVRIRMTVTSGFYVRSLAHDLGAAVGSLAIMTHLSRTRQGGFALETNVLEYSDLAKGEDVWGPKVKAMLDEWQVSE